MLANSPARTIQIGPKAQMSPMTVAAIISHRLARRSRKEERGRAWEAMAPCYCLRRRTASDRPQRTGDCPSGPVRGVLGRVGPAGTFQQVATDGEHRPGHCSA
ncbi:Uncharacterised protein [Mycobacteroides abscessus subsp. abscessus]|nr:Uncharacterised protein [Mycobacteroides abscessus subsp. abscessus]